MTSAPSGSCPFDVKQQVAALEKLSEKNPEEATKRFVLCCVQRC